jgi:CheY-like chemotaxis protein
MEAHGGKIGVYSAGEGRGATFYIELPISFIEYKKKVIYPTETLKKASYIESVSSSTYVSAGDGATMIPDSPSQKSDILTSRTDTSAITSASTKIGNISTSCPVESILVVDDSISNRKMIRRLLESRGRFQFVDEACNGEKALLKIAEKSYDVIMMDSEMPILNGPDAVSIMRSNGYKGLIIGVTGNSLQADMDSFQNAGCNKVISKPIDIDDFVKYVQGM